MLNRKNQRSIYFFALLFLSILGIIYVMSESQLRAERQEVLGQQLQLIHQRVTELAKVDSFILRKGAFINPFKLPPDKTSFYQPETRHVALRLQSLWTEYCSIIQRLDYLHQKHSPDFPWKWEGKQQWLFPPTEEYVRDQAKVIYQRLTVLDKKLGI